MCGIAGLVGHPTHDDLGVIVERMSNALTHRGPDDAGCFVDREQGVALGHRRLSILDLSPLGKQPMTSPSGRHVLAYNGEVYNCRELGREIEARGLRLRGHSDT